MIKSIILIIGSICLGTSYSLSQKLKILIPNEVGLSIFIQGTQTIMQSEHIFQYYNTYGFNKGIGLNAEYKLNQKLNLKLFYNYTELINTYNIYKNNLAFAANDLKKNNPFSYYWISHEIGISLKYKVFSRKNSALYIENSICTNYGQSISNHFPSFVFIEDTMKRNIYYQDGINATLNYKIYQFSVRNMGVNMLNGLVYTQKISSKLKVSLNLAINNGFIPLIGTKINYSIKSPQRTNTMVGDLYATSSNSGLRLGFGINYIIKKDKPKL